MPVETGTALDIGCTSCGESAEQTVCYVGDPIHHLRCSECGTVTPYVLEADGEKEKPGGAAATPLDHAALIERRGSSPLVLYSAAGAYADGQYIAHPTFGDGYVLAVLWPTVKMEVLFADKRRVLVCGRGSTTGRQAAERDAGARSREADRAASVEASSPTRAARSTPKLQRKRRDADTSGDKPVKCPVCGHVVHPFNLSRSIDGTVVGCMRCR